LHLTNINLSSVSLDFSGQNNYFPCTAKSLSTGADETDTHRHYRLATGEYLVSKTRVAR